MSIRTIPITAVKADLPGAVRLAVGEIQRFLGMFYPQEAIERTEAAQAIAGQWLSRIKGFQNDDDFWHLTRDFLAYVLSGGERSRISDQLAYYFSGFMPSYGAACAFLDMVADGRPWSDVQAFMHTLSYGNARQYVEGFDWAGGQKKAQAEADAWKAILMQQDEALQNAAYGEPVLLAQAEPQRLPSGPRTDIPANDPIFPKPRPELRSVPRPIEPAVEATATRGMMAELLSAFGLRILAGIVLMAIPGNVLQGNHEQEWLDRQRAEQEKQNKLLIPVTQPDTEAITDTTNNDCKQQTEENKKNGEICEKAGYTIMETVLQYKRLVDPPRGRGLDGLFEKLPPPDTPNPMPQTVTQPKPGKLVFIPPAAKPPQGRYDYAAMELGKPAASIYPKFVVFEAKNIAKSFDPKDTQDIEKEAKNRLGNTCDGTQLGKKWTAERIPQALERQYPGAKNATSRRSKMDEIDDAYYARWIFVCLPGPVGSNSKLFVLIDVVASGMDLESRSPRPRKGKPSTSDTTY